MYLELPNLKILRRILFLPAIRSLPASLCKDYFDAVRLAPGLLNNEDHVLRYLRCEHGNTWTAALRLVQNATQRRVIFGDEYWLRPMRLQNGVLRPEDFSHLRQGLVVLRTPPDQQRQVAVVDFGRARNEENDFIRYRCVYYYFAVELTEQTIENGLDIIIVVNSKGINVRPNNGRAFQVRMKTNPKRAVPRLNSFWDVTLSNFSDDTQFYAFSVEQGRPGS